MKKRKKYSAAFKFKVASQALKEQKTLSQLASEYGLQPSQISAWKKQLKAEGPRLFERKSPSKTEVNPALLNALYQKIGELEMQLDWAKKKGLLE